MHNPKAGTPNAYRLKMQAALKDNILQDLWIVDPDLLTAMLFRKCTVGYHPDLHWYAQYWHTGE